MTYQKKIFSIAASVMFITTSPAALFAETPANTFIQAWTIDDIISFDPAEVFEFTASEVLGNTYETLISYDPNDVNNIYGEVAESWEVSEDGKTISFKIKEGRVFASGNPITAEDAVFSLVRAVKLDKSPAFILTQFGINADNVEDMIVQTGDYSFDFKMDKAYAPSLVLYCLTANIGSVVDKKLVMENASGDDYGYEWLKTNYAGSGYYKLMEWRANEAVILERNENFNDEMPTMERVIIRHIPEAGTQRLLLEKGDIDAARNLTAEDINALSTNENIRIEKGLKGSIYYFGLNQKNEYLSKPEVRQAMKYLVDYQTIADTIMANRVKVHQSFLPNGFLGTLDETPFSLNVEKAKELLAEADLPDGFTVTMDTRNTPEITAMAQAIQQTMAEAGVNIELIPGDGKQTLTKYRARNHDIYIGRWGPDYQDPNTNASTFAVNLDNSDEAESKPLAWRNAWSIPEMSAVTESAMLEADAAKRAEIYKELQKESQETSPFVIMFQENEVIGFKTGVNGFVVGPSFNDNSYQLVTK